MRRRSYERDLVQFGLTLFLTLLSCTLAAQEEVDSDHDFEAKLQQALEIMRSTELEAPPNDKLEPLVEFLEKAKRLNFNIQRESRELSRRLLLQQRGAAAGILAHGEVSDDAFYEAAQLGMEEYLNSSRTLSKEELFKAFFLARRQFLIGCKKKTPSMIDISSAFKVASMLEDAGHYPVATQANKLFAEQLDSIKNNRYARWSQTFSANAIRLGLLGNPLELAGNTLNGEAFNWSNYQGKVVLIAFWTSRSRQFLNDDFNLQGWHAIYHDRGFEMIGVNLDTSREAAQKYVDRHGLPSVNLFEDRVGRNHPMANQYGIRSAPAYLLVDQNGIVVSLKAKQMTLWRELHKRLGPAMQPAGELALAGDWKAAALASNATVEAKPYHFDFRVAQAAAWLYHGNLEEYRACIQRALLRLDETNDHHHKNGVVWMCCMAEDSGVAPERVHQLAKDSLDSDPDDVMRALMKSISAYRMGDYKACISLTPERTNISLYRALSSTFRTMAAYQLGQKEQATQWLARSRKIVKAEYPRVAADRKIFGIEYWARYAIAHSALKEAEEMMNAQN